MRKLLKTKTLPKRLNCDQFGYKFFLKIIILSSNYLIYKKRQTNAFFQCLQTVYKISILNLHVEFEKLWQFSGSPLPEIIIQHLEYKKYD